MSNGRGITISAAKTIYRKMVEANDPNLNSEDIANELDLWIVDEWTHAGCCIVVCLENTKLVEGVKKGNQKLIESLIGKTMKFANMTVDAELIRELMPMIIKAYW